MLEIGKNQLHTSGKWTGKSKNWNRQINKLLWHIKRKLNQGQYYLQKNLMFVKIKKRKNKNSTQNNENTKLGWKIKHIQQIKTEKQNY